MKLTDRQQKIIDLAIEVLKPFNTEKASYYTYYFTKDEDGTNYYDREHDCCDNEKCIEAELKNLRKEYGNFNVHAKHYLNDGDHDSIERCCICSKPLNESMCWNDQEFEHHYEYSRTKKHFTSSSIALELSAILCAFPTNEYYPSSYERANESRLKKALKRQKDHVNKFISYAEHILQTLFPISEEELKHIEEIGGLWTIKGRLAIADDIYTTKYINPVKGGCVWKSCFMYEDYHAETIAIAESERKRRKAKARSDQKAKEWSEKKYQESLNKSYGFKDSIKVGNCEEGTLKFIADAKLSRRRKYKGEVLLKIAEKHGVKSYVDRMIKSNRK